MKRYLCLGLLCVLVSGCSRYAEPVVTEDLDVEEGRMRYLLKESSPRSLNEHPKVTPEFRKSFNTSPRTTADEDVPVSKQAEDDAANW